MKRPFFGDDPWSICYLFWRVVPKKVTSVHGTEAVGGQAARERAGGGGGEGQLVQPDRVLPLLSRLRRRYRQCLEVKFKWKIAWNLVPSILTMIQSSLHGFVIILLILI